VHGADHTSELINEKLDRQGYAVVSTHPPDVKYVEDLEAAQRVAVRYRRGLWDACSGADMPANQAAGNETSVPAEPTAVPLITQCAAFGSFDEANPYYAANSAEDQYYQVLNEVTANGTQPPQGALTHVAGPTEGGFCMTETWESREAFDTFYTTRLRAALEAAQIPVQPKIFEVINSMP
jgi:quinol monooxygenase YgiN